MAVGFRLDWRGDDVKKRAEKATEAALNETGAACVSVAMDAAPVDTGFLKGTIEFERAKKDGRGLVVHWGNWTANYALWVEVGARGRAGRYYLRRAVDAEYPKLAGRIQGRM